MMDKRSLIFIDAGYLSKISRYFGDGKHIKLDLIRFSSYLAQKQSLSCEHIYYYTAPPFQSNPPAQLENKLRAGYDSFIQKMKNNSLITIREGRLQKIGETFTQKGVDTLLTMDLCQEPLARKICTIIIIAADTDFVPILNELRIRHQIKVILYYFTDRHRKSIFSMSNHLLTAVTKSVILGKEDFGLNEIKK
jgi:uncharacterized LabA/DUF88 family protein